MTKQEDLLLDELTDTQYKIIEKLGVLIAANWDSNSLKLEIQNLMKDVDKIYAELDNLEEKK